ncbi:hypothetical protein [Treponema sp.]|uniref:hypothetical protein n=1 Tax=Treponema sp. TaxID=166 RepID=UPI0025E1AFFA|nr:hypothetical protein [Treponema sp.]MCR5217757.1 hypothetical protein [Treponema sp.]
MTSIRQRIIKVVIFTAILALLINLTALILRDDAHSYSRVMMHDLYNQQHIDYLVCGASHVSHGIDPKIVEEKLGKNLYNAGTPSQHIDGTYAILRDILNRNKVDTVFLDIDNGIAASTPFKQRKGFKSEYIVSTYLKDSGIKYDFYKDMSLPQYYLNSFLPIGKDKLITLDPLVLFNKAKCIFNGSYQNYRYNGWYLYKDDDDSIYKGCVYENKFIEDSSFHDTADVPIIMDNVRAGDWDKTVDKIIALCKDTNTKLVFISIPASDFYIMGKGNYDEYYSYAKAFLKERGYDYYDFNFVKKEFLTFNDTEFRDSNHLNHKGIIKFTDIFCDYFAGKYDGEDFFYDSYKEKIADMPEKVFGVKADFDTLKQNLLLNPITTGIEADRLTFDVTAQTDGKEIILAKNTSETKIALPAASTGQLKVTSYLDGNSVNSFKIKYISF